MAIFEKKQAELTDKEVRELTRDLSALEGENLTDWEFGFVTDLHASFDRYLERTRISDNQWEVIHKLVDKYGI